MLALQLILLFIPLPNSTKLIIRISITIRLQTSWQINLKRFSHTQTNHATHFDISFFYEIVLVSKRKSERSETKRNEIKTNVERCQIYFHLCVSYIFATHSSNIWQFYLCENARGNSGQVILSIASIAVQCCGHSSGPLSGGHPSPRRWRRRRRRRWAAQKVNLCDCHAGNACLANVLNCITRIYDGQRVRCGRR